MGSPTFFVLCAALLFALQCLGDNATMTGTAKTSRYWDCCKPSCGWKGKADFNQPVLSCDANDKPLTDFTAGSVCGTGGDAYACSNQVPWAVNDTFAYGFVGAFLSASKLESTWCCACYKLQFTSGNLTGKTMVVQATNTDYDLSDNNIFTFGIPGSNNSYGFCNQEFNVSSSVFGAPVTGVANSSDCGNLPSPQREACNFRFNWFDDAFQPSVNFTRVPCPSALTSITGCTRNDEKSVFGSAAGNSAPSSSAGVSAFYLAAFSVFAVLVPPLFV